MVKIKNVAKTCLELTMVVDCGMGLKKEADVEEMMCVCIYIEMVCLDIWRERKRVR